MCIISSSALLKINIQQMQRCGYYITVNFRNLLICPSFHVVQNSGEGISGKLNVIHQYLPHIQLKHFDLVVQKSYVATICMGTAEVLSTYKKPAWPDSVIEW